MKRAVLFCLAAAVAGCESAEKKAERLRKQMLLDCLTVNIAISNNGRTTPTSEDRAKCDVATREYNKFTSGR